VGRDRDAKKVMAHRQQQWLVRLPSGENFARGLRPQNVVDPLVEEHQVGASMDARTLLLGEPDPGARDQPQQRVALALELALELALADAAIDELLGERGKSGLAMAALIGGYIGATAATTRGDSGRPAART
jgi:hypothetical protein